MKRVFCFAQNKVNKWQKKQSQWEDGRFSAAPCYIRTILALSLSNDKLLVKFLDLIEPVFYCVKWG